jgi:hypothetical protein
MYGSCALFVATLNKTLIECPSGVNIADNKNGAGNTSRYDTTLNELVDNIPTINLEEKTSININYNNNNIYVSNKYKPTNINNINYVIRNSWNIVNFTKDNYYLKLSFKLPDNFVFNSECSYYLNSVLINTVDISNNIVNDLQSKILTINYINIPNNSSILISDIIKFEQYYNNLHSDNLIIPITFIDLTKKYNHDKLIYF